MRSRSRSGFHAGRGNTAAEIGKRRAAGLALVGAFDILGFAVGTEDRAHTTLSVPSPLLFMTNIECQNGECQ